MLICPSVCFVVYLLCLHLYYLCSWPHCWANVGTVCVSYVYPGSLWPKSQPAWHPLCLSERICSGACCHPGPCITFKEVSVRPSPYHSSSTPPPPWLVEAPLGMPGALSSICVCALKDAIPEVTVHLWNGLSWGWSRMLWAGKWYSITQCYKHLLHLSVVLKGYFELHTDDRKCTNIPLHCTKRVFPLISQGV